MNMISMKLKIKKFISASSVALIYMSVPAMMGAGVSASPQSATAAKSPSASTIVDRCAAKLYNAKGIEANFTASSSQGAVSGTVRISGNKFHMTTRQSSTWYDGKSMWVMANGETSLYEPTQEELLETNPLLYIKANARQYNVIYARVQPAGKYLVALLPKSKESDISRIDITISKGSMLPEKILVTPKNGTKATVTINSLRLDRSFSPSAFIYPKDKYPGVEINDLR